MMSRKRRERLVDRIFLTLLIGGFIIVTGAFIFEGLK